MIDILRVILAVRTAQRLAYVAPSQETENLVAETLQASQFLAFLFHMFVRQDSARALHVIRHACCSSLPSLGQRRRDGVFNTTLAHINQKLSRLPFLFDT